MSWEEVAPLSPAVSKRITAVAIGITPGTRTMSRRVFITIQPMGFPDCAWLVRDGAVTLKLGRDAHAGILRIVRGGRDVLRKVGRTDVRTVLQVRSTALAALLPDSAGSQYATPCEATFAADAIDIRLPEWALTPPQPAAAPQAVARPEPFRGLATRTGVGASAAAGRAPL